MAQQEFDVKAFRAIVKAAQKEHGTAEASAEHALRRAVLEGVFPPDFHLSQSMLAEYLSSSRGPILGALHTLDGEGLVDMHPNRGAFVHKLSIKDIKEIYQLRILLGKFMIRSAAELASPADLDDLEAIAHKIVAQEDGDRRYHLIDHFYKRLYEIADQARAAHLINQLRADQGRYWLRLRLVPYTHQTYEVLVQALRDGRPDKAEKWLEKHLTAVFEQLEMALLRQYAEADG